MAKKKKKVKKRAKVKKKVKKKPKVKKGKAYCKICVCCGKPVEKCIC